MMDTGFTRRLDIQYPIIQAPMAGGPATPKLAASVSSAGGLGNLGAAYLSPEQIRNAIREVRQHTSLPFGVNLFAPEPSSESEETIAAMNRFLQPIRKRFGLALQPSMPVQTELFEEQVHVLLEEKVPVFSFTFGIPPLDVIHAMKREGTVVIGTATTVEEAVMLQDAGVDAIVAQGSEAGGHRGTFLKNAHASLIGTMALVPQIVDRVSVPVIASGGIMDGRGILASLALGASAVQMGTAFLASPESGAHPVYKQQILTANEDATDLTYAYSGKAARGIVTEFMEEVRVYPGAIPAFPVQNALTKDIRQAAAQANHPGYMSLWSGQGLRLATDRPAAAIVKQSMDEALALLDNLKQLAAE